MGNTKRGRLDLCQHVQLVICSEILTTVERPHVNRDGTSSRRNSEAGVATSAWFPGACRCFEAAIVAICLVNRKSNYNVSLNIRLRCRLASVSGLHALQEIDSEEGARSLPSPFSHLQQPASSLLEPRGAPRNSGRVAAKRFERISHRGQLRHDF